MSSAAWLEMTKTDAARKIMKIKLKKEKKNTKNYRAQKIHIYGYTDRNTYIHIYSYLNANM